MAGSDIVRRIKSRLLHVPRQNLLNRQGPTTACLSSHIRCTTATPRYRLRTPLHASQKYKYFNRACWPAPRHQEVDEGTWLVNFMHYDLGSTDVEQKTLQTLDSPFGPKVVPHVIGTICHLCVRARLKLWIGAPAWMKLTTTFSLAHSDTTAASSHRYPRAFQTRQERYAS